METTKQDRPIPYAVLKIQFKRLVEKEENKTSIYTKDLLSLIDQYEKNEKVVLLTDVQKKAILPYTKLNPDLEMTPDDILNLLKLVCPPIPMVSTSAPTNFDQIRPRTSSPLSSSIRKRRPSAVETSSAITYQMTTPIQPIHDTAEKEEEDYYFHLTQRLKSSEKSLANMARDNEDRILELQNKVEDMSLEVMKQRKEIQEYKGKEKNSLEQIGALETHIMKIQRSETDQKQVYMSIKSLFDEKCVETQKLQELLRQKELDLEKTEDLLSSFKREVEILNQERSRLIGLQSNLESELNNSAQTHKQLQEQKNENAKLKEIIDSLKTDLNEALHTSTNTTTVTTTTLPSYLSLKNNNVTLKTLEFELIDEDQKLKSVQDEKEYYKNRANEAMEDLGRVKSELDYLRKALDNENRALVNELAELKLKKNNSVVVPPLSPSTSDTTSNMIELNHIIPEPPIIDLWSTSRVRTTATKHPKKKRTVQDLHQSSSSTKLVVSNKSKDRKLTKKDDKIVANTATFALYTLLVYFFGIVTSTFLLDGSTAQSSWEQALVAAASGQVPKSKVLEIILYWIEKLLFESEGLPVS